MYQRFSHFLIFALVMVGTVTNLVACSPTQNPTDTGMDGGNIDIGSENNTPDVSSDRSSINPCTPIPCGPVELCGFLPNGQPADGNGFDDDCNGLVDETCICVAETSHACFPGPSDRANVGICRSGTTRCSELGTWGTCNGAVTPQAEICDGTDNDCNGLTDDGLADCSQALRCPPYAVARPLSEYRLDGRSIDANAQRFHWEVRCDRADAQCPSVMAPDDDTLVLAVVQSGRYRIRVDITRQNGNIETCQFVLYVQGDGLRVELTWDTFGGINSSGVDLDLHLAPIDATRTTPATWFSLDDCYYATCTAPGQRVNWRTSPTDTRFAPNLDITACNRAPEPYGSLWTSAGLCANPRLDLDNLTCDPTITDPTNRSFCFAENINVDIAPQDVTFRAMVNFYRDHGTCTDSDPNNNITRPNLLVFCGGALRAEISGVEDGQVTFPCERNQGLGSSNWSWLAADIRFVQNPCGFLDCNVRPLRARPNTFRPCGQEPPSDDVCQDQLGRVFVKRGASLPITANIGPPL